EQSGSQESEGSHQNDKSNLRLDRPGRLIVIRDAEAGILRSRRRCAADLRPYAGRGILTGCLERRAEVYTVDVHRFQRVEAVLAGVFDVYRSGLNHVDR